MTTILLEVLAWSIVGVLAGLADYWLGIGFGLIASPVLVVLLGYDPRSVASSVAIAQVVAVTPLYLAHRSAGNLGGRDIGENYRLILVLAASSTIAALASPLIFSKLDSRILSVLYILVLLGATIAVAIQGTGQKQASPTPPSTSLGKTLKAALAGLAAGTIKSLTGGGYTLLLVTTKISMGLDTRKAVALTPFTKLAPFTALGTAYTLLGFTNPYTTLGLSLGAITSTPIAAKALRKTPAQELRKTILLLLSALLIIQAYRLIAQTT